MTSAYFISIATFFATIGVADIAFIFAALTKDNTPRERLVFATRGVLIAGTILMFFGFLGNQILDLFGITIPALRTAGGVLLMLIALDMVFARQSGGTSTTNAENKESAKREDISVFPLAMPLIAGPGSISAVILLTTTAGSDVDFWLILAGLLTILVALWGTLLLAIPIQRVLGLTGLSVVSRVVGILLAALAVQFIFDGISSSGILGNLSQ